MLRTINSRTTSNYVQHHVKAHQNEYTRFQDLSYEAQLNCYCDSLAKQVIELHWIDVIKATGEEDVALPLRHSLPLELARVFVNGVKQMTDVGKGLKRGIGKQCSGWWATNYKLKQWKKTNNSGCLNSNDHNEKADHLMFCSNKNISRLFEEHVRQIKEWMEMHYTDLDLATLVVDYRRGRSKRKFVHLVVLDYIRKLSQI